MTALFLACLAAGLLLAVRIMLYGVEGKARQTGAPAIHLWQPAAMGFVTVFGLAGYLLGRSALGGRSPGAVLGWAALAGAAAAAISVVLVQRWSGIVPEHDVDDPRYVLQGHPAKVVTAIGAEGGAGEIVFEFEDRNQRLPARALDDLAVDAGTEVVIERIEDGVAYVEPWAQVEQRL
jgi:membrane protein implicated in regulation of membrane protease activity